MTATLVYVSGCDDVTAVVMDLSDAEYTLAQRIAQEVTASGGGCSPMMIVTTHPGHYGWPDDPIS